MTRNKKSSAGKVKKKGKVENVPVSDIEEIISQIDTRNDALKKIYEFFEKDEFRKPNKKKDD